MQGESRWPRRCGSETRNSPIDAGLENQAAENQETQIYLRVAVGPCFSTPENSAFPEVSSFDRCLYPPVFNALHMASVLHFRLHQRPRWRQMQRIGTTATCARQNISDDVQDREISAAEIHGLFRKWSYGGGACRGIEGALRS